MSFLSLVFLDAQLIYKCEAQLYDCKYFFPRIFQITWKISSNMFYKSQRDLYKLKPLSPKN